MNSAFVGYEELSRSRRVLSTSAFGLDLLNSSYPTKPHLLMTKYTMSFWTRGRKQLSMPTPRQNVYACARLSISGLFFSHIFSHTFQSDQSLPRALGFILCAACGSVVLLYAARVFDYFVLIEIAFMDNQAQITETISRLDSENVR